MKAYDYWLADKYMEHVADAFILDLLHNKSKLEEVQTDLKLNLTWRQILANSFRSRARQLREYAGMHEHMLMLSNFIADGQEEHAIRAIETKAKEMCQIILYGHQDKWRTRWRK